MSDAHQFREPIIHRSRENRAEQSDNDPAVDEAPEATTEDALGLTSSPQGVTTGSPDVENDTLDLYRPIIDPLGTPVSEPTAWLEPAAASPAPETPFVPTRDLSTGQPEAAEHHDLVAIDESPSPLLSANGQVILDLGSRMNAEPWWTRDWVKMPSLAHARDVDLSHGRVGSLAFTAISLRGQKHQMSAEPNQDAFVCRVEADHLIAVVADGVGSASLSHVGSQFFSHDIACRVGEILTHDPHNSLEDAVTEAIAASNDALRALSQPFGVDHGELSTTVTIAVIPLDDSRRRDVLIAAVGDSPAYRLSKGTFELVTPPTKDGDIIDNSTAALPCLSGTPRLSIHRPMVDPGDVICLMSDGLGTPLGTGSGAVGQWLSDRLAHPLTTIDLHRAIAFDRKAEDDDRTLAAIYFPPFDVGV